MKNKQKAKFSFGAYLSFFTRFPIPWWLFLLSLLCVLGLAGGLPTPRSCWPFPTI